MRSQQRRAAWGTLALVLLAIAVYWSLRSTPMRSDALRKDAVGPDSKAQSLELTAASESRAQQRAELPVALDPQLMPAKGDRLELLIQDEQAQPIEGVQVTLYEEPHPSWTARQSTHSDAQGYARLVRQQAGEFRIWLQKRGYGEQVAGPFTMRGRYVLTLLHGSDLELQFELEPGAAPDSLAAVLVRIESLDSPWQRAANTNEQGRARFADVAQGRYRIVLDTRALLAPFSTEIWHRHGTRPAPQRVPAGRIIQAQLVDAVSGAPLFHASAQVATRPSASMFTPRTDREGFVRFAVPDFGPHAGQVRFEAVGYQAWESSVPNFAADASAPRWVVRMQPASPPPPPQPSAATAGIIVKIAGATELVQLQLLEPGGRMVGNAYANAEGLCAWQGLAPGSYRVQLAENPRVGQRVLLRADQVTRCDFDPTATD
jgi:hypothetical protein